MAQAIPTALTGTRTLLPTSDAFWELIEQPIAVSLYNLWTGGRVRKIIKKETLRGRFRTANVTIDWARVARWLKSQAHDPPETGPEGVERHEWAFDREFYIQCRVEQINVGTLLNFPEFGLAGHMAASKRAVPGIQRSSEDMAHSEANTTSSRQRAAGPTRDASSPLSDVPSSPKSDKSDIRGLGDEPSSAPTALPTDVSAHDLRAPHHAADSPSAKSLNPKSVDAGVGTTKKKPALPRRGRPPTAIMGKPPLSAPSSSMRAPQARSSSATAFNQNAPKAGADPTTANGPRPVGAPSTPDDMDLRAPSARLSSVPAPLLPSTSTNSPDPQSPGGPIASTSLNTSLLSNEAGGATHPPHQGERESSSSTIVPEPLDAPPASNAAASAGSSHPIPPIATVQLAGSQGADERPPPSRPPHRNAPIFTPLGADKLKAIREAFAAPHEPRIPAKRRALTSPPTSPLRLGPVERPLDSPQVSPRPTTPSGSDGGPEDRMAAEPETFTPDIIPLPPAGEDYSEYSRALVHVFREFGFVNKDGQEPDFQQLTIHNCRKLSGNAIFAVFGRDPRPSEEFPNGTPFFCKTLKRVWYNPKYKILCALSDDVLHALLEDARFLTGVYVVKIMDVTGHSYTVGYIESRKAHPARRLRIPVPITRPATFFAKYHQIYISVRVDIELCEHADLREGLEIAATTEHAEKSEDAEDSSRSDRATAKGKQRATADTGESQPGARVTPSNDGKTAGASVQAEQSEDDDEPSDSGSEDTSRLQAPSRTSKGEQPASAATGTKNARAKAERDNPRVARTDAEKYLVRYIGAQTDTKGKPWSENEDVANLRQVRDTRLAGGKLISGVDLVDRLLKIKVNDPKAPGRLPGKTVTGMAVAVFLNVYDNWITTAKDIKRIKDLHAQNPNVVAYLASTKDFGTSLNALLKGLRDAAAKPIPPKPKTSSANANSKSRKRPRMMPSVDENGAGPSTVLPDLDEQGYLEPDDE